MQLEEMKIPKLAKHYVLFILILTFVKTIYKHFKAETPKYVCPPDNLGLSEYAKEICVKESPRTCEMFTCRKLLKGDVQNGSYDAIRTAMRNHPRNTTPDSYYTTAALDCERFKKDRGYHLRPFDKQEEDFPIAFNILAHTNAEQVERLLRALYRPQNIYCIHVDARSGAGFLEAIRSIVGCFDNVIVASQLESVVYWGYSRLQADINCMKDLLNSSIQWRYLINTAAQGYPIRSIGEMVRILKIYNGANDIEGIFGSRVIKSRFQMEWEEVPARNTVYMTRRKNPKPPHDLDIVRGSAYGIFSRAFVDFVMHDQRAIDLLTWSRKTLTPDEHYWATLHHTYSNPHLHTPGGYSGHPEDKPWLAAFAEWVETSCRGQVVRAVCVFGIEDLPRLVNRKEFFVNKFYIDFEPLALDCLEAWIERKSTCPEPIDDDYYRKLPFIKN